MNLTITSLLTLTLITSAAHADWPRWRGANLDDHSTETGLLKKWPETGPKQLWTNEDVGLGYAGISVVGGTLFTMGARDATEYVIAIDAATGKEKWATEVGPLLTNGFGNGPRSTPTVDGDKIYALSGKGRIVCLNAADGKVVWKDDLVARGGKIPGWGYTESVLVDGNAVIATPGAANGTLIAFDKSNGNKLWQSTAWTDPAQYASPIAVDHGGKHQIIQLTMQSVAGVNATNGEVIWKAAFPGKTAVIPTPIYHEGKVFVAAGYGVGCKLFNLSSGNEVEEIYSNTNMVNHHGGVILHAGHLYGYSDGKGWVCMDFATGEIKWAEKKALGKGAIHFADDMFYLLDESNGNCVLIDASPSAYTEHGRFTLSPQTSQRSPKGKIWVHPVVSDGKLFLRDQEFLTAYDVKGQ